MLDLIGLAAAGGGETLRSAGASQGGDQSVGHFGELGRGGNGGRKAFTPEGGPEGRQGVGEGRGTLARVPGAMWPSGLVAASLQEPQPDGGVEPESDRDVAAGARAAPGLRVLGCEVLLDLAEGHLDGPAVGVLGDDGSRIGLDVGGEEEVIVLAVRGVADDDHADGRCAGDMVPEHNAAEQQAVHGAVADADLDETPLVEGGRGGNALQGGQACALLAGATALAGEAGGRQLEEGGIAAEARSDHRGGHSARGQGGVGAVADEVEVVIGQPGGQFSDHHGGELDMGWAALDEEAGIDRQGQGLGAAGDADADTDQDDVEAEGVDDLADRGADGVAEDADALDVTAGLVDEGVVDEQVDRAADGAVPLDQGHGLAAPELGSLPAPVTHEAVKGVVAMLALRVGGGEHAGDGATAGAEHPTGGELAEEREGPAREDGDGDGQQGLPKQQALHQDRPPAGCSGAQSRWRKSGSRGRTQIDLKAVVGRLWRRSRLPRPTVSPTQVQLAARKQVPAKRSHSTKVSRSRTR